MDRSVGLLTASALALSLSIGLAGAAQSAPKKKTHAAMVAARFGHSRMSLRFATEPGAAPRPGHLASLVGDRDSGLGFYALPQRYRGNGRAYYTGSRPGDAIRYAVGTEMGSRYYYGVDGGDEIYGDRHNHAMFNPVDGYGTPFFAGYYGPAGDPDEEHGPFGKPYN